jgi:hypothetical protein
VQTSSLLRLRLRLLPPVLLKIIWWVETSTTVTLFDPCRTCHIDDMYKSDVHDDGSGS